MRISLSLNQCHVFQQIFRPSLDDYDVVIRLNPALVSRAHQAVDCDVTRAVLPSFGQVDPTSLTKVPVVNLDYVSSYLKEVRVCTITHNSQK